MNLEKYDCSAAIRRCGDTYENFSDSEKMYFNSFVKKLIDDCRELEGLCSLEKIIELDLKKAEKNLRFFAVSLIVMPILIWLVMFFRVLGENYANHVVLIFFYILLAVEAIYWSNAALNLRFKKIEISTRKILLQQIITGIDRHNFFIRDELEDFVESIEKDGLSMAEDKYMPFLTDGIALLIKNKNRFVDLSWR